MNEQIELEKILLSLVLIDNKSIDFMQAVYKIQPEKFIDKQNGNIFAVMLIMRKKGIVIDLSSFSQFIHGKKIKVFDFSNIAAYVSELTNYSGTCANLDFYCKKFVRDWKIRAIKQETQILQNKLLEEPENTNKFIQDFTEKTKIIDSEDLQTEILTGSIARDILEKDLNFNIAHKNRMVGIPCGFYRIDEETRGFRGGELITLGAVAGGGKSAMADSMIYNMLINGYKVALFSLEMSKEQILERLASIDSKIPLKKIRNGELSESEKNKILKSDTLFGERFFLVDTPLIQYNALKTISKQLVEFNRVSAIFIDYAQLIRTPKEGTRQGYEILTELANNLKSLAKTLNIPIIALSQVNSKGYENKPDMNNLSGGLAFTQASDYIFTLWEEKSETGETIGRTFNALKGRNIRLGTIPVYYNAEILKFEDIPPA